MPRKVYNKYNPDDKVYFVYRHFMVSSVTGVEITFYIGRGKHNPRGASFETLRPRAFSPHGRSDEWNEIHKRCDYQVEVVKDFMTFKEASKLERNLVTKHGRLDLGTGSLVNLCEGGEGTIDRITQRKTLQDHIDDNVAFIPITGCWLWMGSKIDGHCKIHIDNKSFNTKRYIFENLTGIKLINRKQSVKNTCGCADCVNPLHMRIVKGTNVENKHKKITEEDKVDAARLLKYFYPSQISDLFPHIKHNTLRELATRLKTTKVKIEQDWKTEIKNQSSKHLSLEDFVDIRRLSIAGIGSQTLSIMYNLHRTKITGIAQGYRGMRIFNKL